MGEGADRPGDRAVLSDAYRVRHLRRNARSFLSMLVKTRRLTEASQRHEDRMLTWSVGLMGVALFALPPLLSTACARPISFPVGEVLRERPPHA
jgi:hypothetical protein